MLKKKCNVNLYKELAESRLTSAEKQMIADDIHNIKSIEDYFWKYDVMFDSSIDENLARKLFRYLRDSPITKARRAAPGNFPKIIYQKGKSFFTQTDAISEPKLAIAYQALRDVMEGIPSKEIQKYGLMACEYIRYLHPISENNGAAVWYMIKGSGRLETVFGLTTPQPKIRAENFRFATQLDHFIIQSNIQHKSFTIENIGYY